MSFLWEVRFEGVERDVQSLQNLLWPRLQILHKEAFDLSSLWRSWTLCELWWGGLCVIEDFEGGSAVGGRFAGFGDFV